MVLSKGLNREALLRKNKVCELLYNEDHQVFRKLHKKREVPRTGFEPRSTASQEQSLWVTTQ